MNRKVFYRKTLYLFLMFFLISVSCKTTKISVNKRAWKKVKTIAIMKFETEEGIKRRVAAECEESFKGHFIDLSKNVVERRKLSAIMKEMEINQSGLVESTVEIGKMSGAQALLFGNITQYSKETREVTYNEYVKVPIKKKKGKKKKKKGKNYKMVKVTKKKNKKFFTFQIHIRLVSTETGNTILTLKNMYPERDYEMTSRTTLARFRESILNQMGEDMKKALKKKKK